MEIYVWMEFMERMEIYIIKIPFHDGILKIEMVISIFCVFLYFHENVLVSLLL